MLSRQSVSGPLMKVWMSEIYITLSQNRDCQNISTACYHKHPTLTFTPPKKKKRLNMLSVWKSHMTSLGELWTTCICHFVTLLCVRELCVSQVCWQWAPRCKSQAHLELERLCVCELTEYLLLNLLKRKKKFCIIFPVFFSPFTSLCLQVFRKFADNEFQGVAPQISYEYFVPTAAHPHSNYVWKARNGACTKTCGGGQFIVTFSVCICCRGNREAKWPRGSRPDIHWLVLHTVEVSGLILTQPWLSALSSGLMGVVEQVSSPWDEDKKTKKKTCQTHVLLAMPMKDP